MVFPARSALFNHNILNTKAISHFQANHILIRFVFPPLDELLLGYKDRTDVLPSEHYSKAFTGNGLFFPVILYEGQIVGNWDRKVKRNGCDPGYSLFRQESRIDEALLDKAQQQYMQFLGK